MLVEGPYGRLSARARTQRKVALIGAGVGVTPLRALAEELDYAPGEAVLLHRFTERPLFDREFAVLGRRARAGGAVAARAPPGAGLLARATASGPPTTSPRCSGGCPTSPSATSTSAAPSSGPTTSGGPPLAAGLPADRFHVESFGW